MTWPTTDRSCSKVPLNFKKSPEMGPHYCFCFVVKEGALFYCIAPAAYLHLLIYYNYFTCYVHTIRTNASTGCIVATIKRIGRRPTDRTTCDGTDCIMSYGCTYTGIPSRRRPSTRFYYPICSIDLFSWGAIRD